MTLRDALTRSKNTATVRLAEQVGIPVIVGRAHELGITTPIPDVPATALGAAAVRPIEMVQAYAAFANGGYRVEPHFIRKVVARHGQVVWEGGEGRSMVIDPAAAFVLTTMLQDVVNRGTGAGARRMGVQGPVGGKTGSTNDYRDAWFVGFSSSVVVGVWVGFDQPQTIREGGSGARMALPIWAGFMRRAPSAGVRPRATPRCARAGWPRFPLRRRAAHRRPGAG